MNNAFLLSSVLKKNPRRAPQMLQIEFLFYCNSESSLDMQVKLGQNIPGTTKFGPIQGEKVSFWYDLTWNDLTDTHYLYILG